MPKNNERESGAETYTGPSKSGKGRSGSAQPGTPGYDKKLDGPNRPSV